MKKSTFKTQRWFLPFLKTCLMFLLVGWSWNAQSQVTVTGATTGDGVYLTLGAAFTAINPPNINTGAAINIELSGNTTEATSATLNSSDWASVNITAVVPVTISGTITGAIIKLNGADNVTIDGSIGGSGRNITISNLANLGSTAAVWIASTGVANAGAINNTIRNCNISCGVSQNTATLTTIGVLIGGTTISTTATTGLDNDNNAVIDNFIIKCRFGIVTRGQGATNLNQNTVITDNLVGPASFGVNSIGVCGILTQFENNCLISRNEVRFVGGDFANTTAGTDRCGIGMGTTASGNTSTTTTTNTNYTCTRNIIHDIIEERTFSASGIVLGTTNAGLPTNDIVCNNVIYNVKSNGTSGDCTSGICISGSHTAQVVNNSIYLYGDIDPNAAAVAAAMVGWGIRVSAVSSVSFANLSIKNNIVHMDLSSSSAPGIRFYAIGCQSAAYAWGTGGCDHNDYYLNPSNTQVRTGGFSALTQLVATTEFPTLANWQGAFAPPQDANSIQLDPGYTSTTDLHINVGNPNVNALGTIISGACDLDIDGDLRDVNNPDLGADEYTPLVCTGAVGGAVSPSSANKCENQTLTMSTSGSTVGAGTTYQWEVSLTGGGAGFSDATGGSGANLTSYTTGPLSPGVYYYRLRVECSFGGLDYSDELTLNVNGLPNVIASSNVASLCQPGATPAELSATGADTYAWSPAGSLSSASGTPVNASPIATTLYTVVGTDANGCTKTSTVSLGVFYNPTNVVASASPNTVCTNGSSEMAVSVNCDALKITEVTQFRAGTGATNPYPAYIPIAGDDDFVEISNLSSDPIDASGIIYEIWTTTTLFRTFTLPSGTIVPGNSTLIISTIAGVNNPLNNLYFLGATGVTTGPLSSSTLSGHLIKQGGNIIDAVALTGYTWPVASNITSANWAGNIPTASGTAGVKRVAAVDNNLASDWVVASAASPQTIGSLNPTVAAISCSFTYLWQPSTFIGSQQTLQFPTADSINSNITYTVTVTNAGGCSSTSSVSISSIPLSCSAATTTGVLCASNGAYSVTANFMGGGAPYSFTWDDGNSGVYPDAQTITPNLPVGTYTLTCTIADGCSASCTSSIVITVNGLPTVSATTSLPAYCIPGGAAVSLNASGADTYAWSPSAGLSATTGSPVDATPSITSTYTVVGTDLNGCTNTTTIGVNVGAAVTASPSASPASVCPGEGSVLTANASIGSAYCAAGATTGCGNGDEFIGNVTVGTINNTTTCATTYTDFSSISTNMVVGMSYSASVLIPAWFTGDQASIWIDFNQDGDFVDLGEQVNLLTGGGNGTTPLTGTITVPVTAVNGPTRMRVRGAFTGAMVPCGNMSFGEVEDYTVNISGGVDPFTYTWSESPANATLASLTGNPVNANNIPSATMYTVIATSSIGCSGSGTVGVTMNSNGVRVGAKAILSGAYDVSSGLMHDSLRSLNLVPLTEPYTAAPYNKAVISEPAGETITATELGVSGNNAIVDWVFIEIRSASNSSTVLATRRALIQRDGDIVDVNGTSPVYFPSLTAGAYYVSVKHRNHLGIMTATPVNLESCVLSSLDFTSIPVWVKAGEVNGPRRMYAGVGALWSSDANFNKNSKYNGLSNDKQAVLNLVGVLTPNNVVGPTYKEHDLNMDGKVKYNNTDNDRNVIANTVGVSTPNNIVNQHTPN